MSDPLAVDASKTKIVAFRVNPRLERDINEAMAEEQFEHFSSYAIHVFNEHIRQLKEKKETR